MNRFETGRGFVALPVLATAFVMSFVTGACAPKDEYFARNNKKAEETLPQPKVTDVADRLPDLARHGILQLTHTQRYLDLAIGYRIGDRLTMSSDSTAIVTSGCRVLQKLFPDYRRDFETSTERLQVVYVKCESQPALQAASSTGGLVRYGKMRGSEQITVVYDKPYPREDNPALTLGFPTTINVAAADLQIEMLTKNDTKTVVSRSLALSADRISTAEDFDTYRVSNTVRDVFTLDAKSGRTGSVTVELRNLVIKVSKAVPREIVETQPGTIIVSQRTSSLGGDVKSKSEPAAFVEVTLEPAGAFSKSANVCLAPAGRFKVTKRIVENEPPVYLNVSGNEMKLESGAVRSTQICEQPDGDVFMNEFESLYL